jgi:dihydrofolate reductase
MGIVKVDISVSLDGYVAGPEASLEEPLGAGGEQLHEWVIATRSWREQHDQEGGEEGADSEVSAEMHAGVGAVVMGRRMFSGGSGPWEEDPKARGWWGDEPPFHMPVYVLTHHEREPLEMDGGTTFHFVGDGIEAALARARETAGAGDVLIAGGAATINQALEAGLVEQIQLHVTPALLGGGARLFEGVDPGKVALERERVIDSPAVTHLRYAVAPS